MNHAYNFSSEDGVLTAPKPEPEVRRSRDRYRIRNIQCVVEQLPAVGNAQGMYDPSCGLFINDSSSLPKQPWTEKGFVCTPTPSCTITASTTTYLAGGSSGGGINYTATTRYPAEWSNANVGGCFIIPAIKGFEPDPLINELTLSGSMAMGTITFVSVGSDPQIVEPNKDIVIAARLVVDADMASGGDGTIDPPSPLSAAIVAKRKTAKVDADYIDIADAATGDALAVVARAGLSGDPRIMFSDDGILTLQWQRGEHGVALIFAGDGLASIAFRRPGQFYAENGIDVSISDELPPAFKTALATILA